MKVDASVPQPFTPPNVRAEAQAAPTLPLMHVTFLLAGFGTMMLGPILPLLAARWHLVDSQLGLLIMAQFIGATLGGVTVSSRLTRDLHLGLIAGGLGFFGFSVAPGLQWAIAALVLGGFGVGRIIATVNIIAGARYTANRGAALARLNFSWSIGALLSPLLAAWLIRVPLFVRIFAFAWLFMGTALALGSQISLGGTRAASALATTQEPSLNPRIFVYFAALLFLYGGLETCLSGWLTTYALRFGHDSLVLSDYTMVLLLCGLTAGRALASWMLFKMRDSTLQRISLILAAGLAAALAAAHRASLIATFAVLLGITLAPIFPATFAILMANRPPARTAGIVLAGSGLGAAALPWLMGVISTQTGSLQTALTLPVAAALLMFALTLIPSERQAVTS